MREQFLWITGKYRKLYDRDGKAKPYPTLPFDGDKLKTGVMDTMMFTGGQLIDDDAHMSRLERHAAIAGLEFSTFHRQDSLDVFRKLRDFSDDGPYRANIIIAQSTSHKRYHVIKLIPYEAPADHPQTLVAFDDQRVDPDDIRFKVKHVDRSLHLAAMAYAKKQGANLAILLNREGRVTCVDRGNIVIFTKDKRYITPPLSEGVMNGITRAKFMTEHSVEERPLTMADLEEATTIHVMNSLMGVRKAVLKPS